jgi:BirA family biotin operon repressor/biotin-[acetyl-CoA-carboxylase] ligase
MSALVRGPVAATVPHLAGTALGVVAADAVEELSGVAVGLKWPNDLVVAGAGADGGDRKLGGLLAELVDGTDPAVVVGLGCNLRRPEGFPPDLAEIATALDLLGASVDREDLVVALLEGFGAALDRLADDGGAALLDRYRERCVTLGRVVRVELPTAVLVGTAVDLDRSGGLVVEDDQGVRRSVTTGDVVHLRPA